MVKIDKKIVSYSVVSKDDKMTNEVIPEKKKPVADVLIVRGESLQGKTYKVKTPLTDHALYITINDMDGRPFEIFFNSKSMEHFQWIIALSRVLSAVFRKGGDVSFLVEELENVFDPKGGYFKKGGKYMPSLVAEIGDVLRTHLIGLGLLEVDTSLSDAAKKMVHEKLGMSESLEKAVELIPDAMRGLVCPKCGEPALVKMDGCLTCTACGDSKCN